MSEVKVFDLSAPTEQTISKPYWTGPEWTSRDAYAFVVSRLGKFLPWNPKGWPNEVADQGCRCTNHSFMERYEDGEPTNIWVCTECGKPKTLMTYVEWCESCGIPYVVRKSPDRTGLCRDCGG